MPEPEITPELHDILGAATCSGCGASWACHMTPWLYNRDNICRICETPTLTWSANEDTTVR